MAKPYLRLGAKVVGLKETQRMLKKGKEQAKDLRPVLRGPIRSSIHQFFNRQFNSQGSFGGNAWRGLTATTLELKARHNRGGMGVLRFSNRLWASLVKRSDGGDQVVVIRKHSLEVGTGVPYAAQHQDGYNSVVFGNRTGRKVPPRKIVPDELPVSLVNAWDRFLIRHLEA